MIASYDTLSRIIYIRVKPTRQIKKTCEYDANAVLELDDSGDLVGIEMIKPSRRTLQGIANKFERYELAQVDFKSIRKAFGFFKT